ncbi:helix-turn-helix transcriptional regulator [Haloprofundus salinisoli]|uniref:helix-turn-helix transcriptional regulator n=1 Tax=Haloprofundus salinisoli TaxID=2876193 RepID=UPI001CC922F2|nr:helix-turn-helix domain-containing protein [Haloprofundus salinisoli]
MHRRAPFVLLAIFLVAAAVAPPAAAFSGTRAGGSTADTAPNSMAAMQQSFDSSEVRIVVHEDGSARWTFHYEQTLANETERENFETFATEFNNSQTPLYNGFKSESQSLVKSGSNSTERPMNAQNHSRQAYVTDSLGNTIGVVEMSFVWTNFAQIDENSGAVTVGDVFEGGLYISENQSLVVESGENLEFKNVTPAAMQSNTSSLPASDSVTWMGEKRFTDNRPQIVFVPEGTQTIVANGDGNGSGGAAGTDGVTTTPIGSGGGSMWLAGAVLVIFGGVAVALWYRRGREETVDSVDTETGTSTEAAAIPPEPSVSDEELLSDEDRVISMLEDHGGRMRQVRIVEETEWSKSKVSMLLSEMEDEGFISKLRVGRENVISLDGHEPEATKSPFDDE